MKNVKSLLALVLACMMIASMIVVPVSAADVDVWDGTADTSWYNTSATTFTLTTAEQLAGLAQLVNGGNTFSGKTIKLGADIQLQSDADMAGYASWSASVAPANEWTPIGWYNVGHFAGTFDGDGHTVSGMYINDADASQFDGRASFIGYANTNATTKNLTITKSYVNAKTCTAILYAFTSGFPAKTTNVDIVDCTVVGGTDGTGLLMGKTGGPGTVTISDCDLSGNVTCGYSGAGIVGFISGTGTMTEINVINCSTDVNITRTYTGDGGNGVGAVFGTVANTSGTPTVKAINIKNTDGVKRDYKVSIDGNRTFGGIIGLLTATTLGDITIDGINVVTDLDCTNCPSNVNASDIGAVIGYIRADSHTGTIAFKNMSVSGYTSGSQNSGILIGRINTRSAATTDIQTIVVDNVDTNVVFEGLKASGNCQCIGGVVGLSQKPITTLKVTDYISNNTFRATNSVAESKPSDLGGLVGSATITNANISNCILNDSFDGRTSVGGMFGTGTIKTANISDCIVSSTVTGTDGVAGIVGNFKGETLKVKNCVVDSILSGAQYVAGFVGDTNTNATTYPKCYFTFEGCMFTGSVVATNRNAGGFVGDYDTGSGTSVAGTTNNCGIFTFKDCLVDADISADSNAGGLIGRIYPPNGKLIVENVSLLGDRTGTNAAVLVGTYGGENTLADLVTLNNLYFDNGSVVNFFGVEGTSVGSNIYADGNTYYTSDKLAEFEAILAASEAWGLGSDGEYYPIGINYPGHDHIWGAWDINMEVEPNEKTHYCEIVGCGAYETEVYLPEDDACTCRDGGDWTAWRVQYEATCDKDGQAYRLCHECGAQETAVLTAGHVWGGWKTEFCSAVATRTCTRCGEGDEKAVTVNHNAVLWVVTKYASATEAGEENKICRNCGEVFDTRVIPAYGVPAVPTTPGTTPAVPSTTPTYTDIAGHKYEEAIMIVTKAGLFNGMGDDKFAPDATMTRAMLITVLARLQNVDVSAYKNTFTDVPADSYYAPYVGWAEAAGITNGIGDGKFGPDEEITREQALTMIARYLEYVGEDMVGNKTGTFTDLGTTSDWAADSVAKLVKLGIVEFDSTTLRPTADATRAELASFFANLLEILG